MRTPGQRLLKTLRGDGQRLSITKLLEPGRTLSGTEGPKGQVSAGHHFSLTTTTTKVAEISEDAQVEK